MLPVLLFVLGSTVALQETTTGDTDPTAFTTVQFPTDETFPTTLTVFPERGVKRVDATSCKNQFLCNLQKKSSLSKGFPPVPSKNLVPPFTDSEEDGVNTTEDVKTTLFDSDTEAPQMTTLIFQPPFSRSSITPIIVQKRDNPIIRQKPEATNELRSYVRPGGLSAAPAQIDLSYLPPQGVLPAAAAASLDISRVNFQPPVEESPAAAAQTDARLVKPDAPNKDICSDAFHSFLCTPLKSRKRITGALPNSLNPNPSFSPAPSNTVQNSIRPSQYLPSSTTAKPSPTTPAYAPLPSNVDRSYLPPASKPIAASPSFNSVRVAHAKETTTRKPVTSTPRPFIQTSIIPFIAPKVIEQINFLPSTTTKQPTTARRPTPTTTTPATLYPEPSNEVNRGYLPPSTTTKRPTTTRRPTPPTLYPEPSNEVNRGYLPPSTTTKRPTTTRRPTPPTLYPEPSNEVSRGYLPPSTTTKQPFINLSAALPTFRQKPKPPSVQIIPEATKRVTTTTPRYSPAPSNADRNYLPPESNFQSAAAAQAGNRALPSSPPQHDHHDHHDHHHHGRDICSDPFHSFLCAPLKQRKRITGALPPGFNPQSTNRKETRVRPEATPKPEPSLKPENTFQLESRVKPTEETAAANALIPGYQYPKPSPGFPLPSQTATELIRPTTGYTYPKPSTPFPLPSQQNIQVISKEDRLAPTVAFPGYQYPKPSVPFPLPFQQQPQRLPSTAPQPLSPQPSTTPPPRTNAVSTTAKPLQPQASDQRTGYQYPKPAGYQYPKPAQPLLLPVDIRSGSVSTPSSLGSAEFIPVNKIDAKRQVSETGLPRGSPRFGERIRSRVREFGISRTF